MNKFLLLIGLSVVASACSDSTSDAATGGGGQSATGAGGSTDNLNGAGGGTGGSVSNSGGNAPGGCESYLFCEDFEEGSVGETPPGWTERGGWDQGGSRAVLSSEESHGGEQSLKGAVGTNGQYRIEHALDSELANNHWGRIFYKVKTPIALDGQYVHNTFVAFGRPDSDNGNESRIVDTVVAPDGTHQFLFNVPDDSCCASSSYDFSYEGDWHCAEWHVEAETQSFRFFYNGEEVTDIAFEGVAGAHIGDFSSIIVGWINYQSPSTPNEGWFDDIALDDERIGCDR
jgi:hypothetical protein